MKFVMHVLKTIVAINLWCPWVGQACGGVQERSTVDRKPDSDSTVHVVYAVPSDFPDRRLDVNGQISGSIELMQQWLAYRTGKKCDPGLRIRFDKYKDGADSFLDVTFLRLRRKESEMANAPARLSSRMAAELAAAGLHDLTKIYLVYYDGSHPECGEATGPPNAAGSLALVNLRAEACKYEVFGVPVTPMLCPCNEDECDHKVKAGKRELGALHEVFHALGAVDARAEANHGCGHVNDRFDLMFGKAGDCSWGGEADWEPDSVDVNRQTYFGHGRPTLVDVASSKFLTGSQTTAPPGWPIRRLTAQPCSASPKPSIPHRLGTTRSGVVQFINTTGEAMELYWHDKNGSLVDSGLIEAYGSVEQQAFTAQYWQVTGRDGECRAVFHIDKGGLLHALIK